MTNNFTEKETSLTVCFRKLRFFLLSGTILLAGLFFIQNLFGISQKNFSSFLFSSVSAAEQTAEKTPKKQLPPVRVLIITGVDYPGHPWKETAPALRKMLDADEQIEARVCEDVEILGTDVVFDYDVLLIHFKNYDLLHREKAAQENLVEFVNRGGGLVYFHFSCGAFQEWDGFEQVAGRVWNPSFRGHDPIQEFEVKITDAEHPITKNLENFKITDELYTCLDGKRNIHVIAEATSTVDKKNYPIAFVFEQEKGRVFHTVLGHDLRAVSAPGVAPLMINAVLWTAKRLESNSSQK